MMKYKLIVLTGCILLEMCSYDLRRQQDFCFKDEGDYYARARITIGEEMESIRSKKSPEKYHCFNLLRNPNLNHFKTMQECVSLYIDDGNLAGIRGAFLEAYYLASTPCRSSDILASYGEPIRDLKNSLGDMQFALCLGKMRPEVQSAVFYILYYTYWPPPGKDKNSDDRRATEEPHTFALSKKVARLKWPSDYEM